MTTSEEWRQVPGFEGRYDVSSWGRVRGWRGPGTCVRTEPRIMRAQRHNTNGYLYVPTHADGKPRGKEFIHHWVAAAFIGPRPPGMQVNHRDGMALNNTASNLEYVTPAENVHHAMRMGLHHTEDRHPRAKLMRVQVEECRAAVANGTRTIGELAREFGVTWWAMRNAIRGTTWKTVPGAVPPNEMDSCHKGHPRTPENRITIGGRERCRICRRASQDAWIAREAARRKARARHAA